MTPIRPVPLESGEWYDQDVAKETIFLHHTAAGTPGLWTHTNVRADKSDCSPQRALVNLIRSL